MSVNLIVYGRPDAAGVRQRSQYRDAPEEVIAGFKRACTVDPDFPSGIREALYDGPDELLDWVVLVENAA